MYTKSLFTGIFFLILSLFSCDFGNSDSGVVVTTDTVETVAVTAVNVEENQQDTLTTVEESKEGIVLRYNTLAKEIQLKYNKLTNKQNHYVENVEFQTFLGKTIEFGELEVRKIGDNFTWIYADYFNGNPIGGKRFFLENGNLFMVEIIRLYEKVTEQGTMIVESKTHTFYYQNEQLVQVIDNKKNIEVDVATIPWAEENLKDWSLVNLKIYLRDSSN